jgi:hypothetical protein
MEWVNVTSSNLLKVRYLENEAILEIEFKNGRIYQYFEVPKHIYDGLIASGSHGEYFNNQIKGYFRFARA